MWININFYIIERKHDITMKALAMIGLCHKDKLQGLSQGILYLTNYLPSNYEQIG